MKHLLTIRETDIYPEKLKLNLNPEGFKLRNAALLKASAYNYHKLPGGGVDGGEDMKLALRRELLEEVGCRASIISEVGEVIEYRDRWNMKQISHCYLAKQTGRLQPPDFTQSEIDEGFEIVWADTIEDAIKLLEKDRPQNYDGLFIQQRDTQLLKAAWQILNVQ